MNSSSIISPLMYLLTNSGTSLARLKSNQSGITQKHLTENSVNLNTIIFIIVHVTSTCTLCVLIEYYMYTCAYVCTRKKLFDSACIMVHVHMQCTWEISYTYTCVITDYGLYRFSERKVYSLKEIIKLRLKWVSLGLLFLSNRIKSRKIKYLHTKLQWWTFRKVVQKGAL